MIFKCTPEEYSTVLFYVKGPSRVEVRSPHSGVLPSTSKP